MKSKIFASIVIMGLLICFSAVSAIAIPTATLNLLDSNIAVGESFDVEVWVDGDNIGEELLAFGFNVSIDDGTNFSYDDYSIGAGFDDDSAMGFNPHDVGGSAFPGIVNDDVLLATLSFTALAEGTDTLNVLGLFDDEFSGLFYAFSGHDIAASLDITVVPVPATFLLFITGLAGLSGMRWKFKK